MFHRMRSNFESAYTFQYNMAIYHSLTHDIKLFFFRSRAIESTFTIELVKARYHDYARIFLSSLGYICKWEFVYTTCKPCSRGTFKSKVKDECEVCPAGKLDVFSFFCLTN